ncbi:hypothetical protein [Pontibacter mucosus]|uniref:hypothetical protein n=1 Tax=Pontibacter mucosus TaxID=1649266 RepID=UPI001B8620F5|nr:hypothetical protein [Pontibacter mucosus]
MLLPVGSQWHSSGGLRAEEQKDQGKYNQQHDKTEATTASSAATAVTAPASQQPS